MANIKIKYDDMIEYMNNPKKLKISISIPREQPGDTPDKYILEYIKFSDNLSKNEILEELYICLDFYPSASDEKYKNTMIKFPQKLKKLELQNYVPQHIFRFQLPDMLEELIIHKIHDLEQIELNDNIHKISTTSSLINNQHNSTICHKLDNCLELHEFSIYGCSEMTLHPSEIDKLLKLPYGCEINMITKYYNRDTY